ncbi:major tail protein [Virgibacillus salexigens]|uniref:major tail protein n=1 Tax=Virgibacillus salexigens TaxID=61016 RepID=UPI003081A344
MKIDKTLIPLDLQYFANKVNFGLKNAHYALITVDEETGEETYGTPIKMPGSVELSLEPRGDMVEFYADDMLFYSAPNNQGYDGTLSIANIPDSFAVDVLGEEQDETDMVLTEKSNAKPGRFAFMFEFDGDVKATRHVLYNCSANRPTVSGSTKTDSVEPSPNELTFVASAREKDNAVKTKTLTTTPAGVYDAWYQSVYEKTPAA